MARKSVAKAAEAAAEGLAQEMGYIYVDTELTHEHGAAFLRVYVDAPGGMSLEKCETFHRALVKRIDELEYDYLEVSSPGLDRPLKRDADYERNLGKEIELRLFEPLDGQKRLSGTLISFDRESATIETPEGEKTVPRRGVSKAAPVLRLEEELQAEEEAETDGNDEGNERGGRAADAQGNKSEQGQ